MPEHYLPILLILLAGAFTQGLTGFGSALVSLPLLVLYMDIRVAVPLSILNGLLITIVLSLQLKSHLDWRKIGPLLAGFVPGVGAGVAFLKKTSEPLFLLILGLMLIAFSLYRLLAKPKPIRIGRSWGVAAGFASGAISAAFSAGGPPSIIYATLTGWTKHEIKATLSIYFFLGGLATAAAHLLSGLTTGTVLHLFTWSSPAILIGVWSGSLLYGRFRTEGYLKLVLIALFLMGVIMLISAAKG
ncbi:MAG: sulfite exporter TauE/SafE family protein [Proteobacteria bacterium]|nr:sulfite exporter TauE/SafE family protein [Pseudomonadota bacterium]MBU1686128.1 sulfite exporter TauE/SafE family protein [Pseudomonadota bacterium]